MIIFYKTVEKMNCKKYPIDTIVSNFDLNMVAQTYEDKNILGSPICPIHARSESCQLIIVCKTTVEEIHCKTDPHHIIVSNSELYMVANIYQVIKFRDSPMYPVR
jgi:hypothetical protein